MNEEIKDMIKPLIKKLDDNNKLFKCLNDNINNSSNLNESKI